MFVENFVYVFKQIIEDALQTAYFIHTMLVCRILIGGVMVDMLVSKVVDRGSSHGMVKPKTIQLLFIASLLSTQR
jgi:hypothetical protein